MTFVVIANKHNQQFFLNDFNQRSGLTIWLTLMRFLHTMQAIWRTTTGLLSSAISFIRVAKNLVYKDKRKKG